MKFLIDAQLPPFLSDCLKQAGFESKAVRELGLREASDYEIWNYALNNDFIIITKDEDFVDQWIIKKPTPTIVWLRIGNCSNPFLWEWFKNHLAAIIQKIESGETLIEVTSPH